MSTTVETDPFLDALLRLYEERRSAIRARLEEFRRVPPGEVLYELLYCLLTPQSSARNAAAVMSILRERRFADSPFDAVGILRSNVHYIRFHNTKAARLIKAAEQFPLVKGRLASADSPAELRSWLAKNVDGFGLKEATHFLRNIGRNGGLAILDRHILRNLARVGVVEDIPATMSERTYLGIEKAFMAYAAQIGIPLDELDLLFWSLETGEILK